MNKLYVLSYKYPFCPPTEQFLHLELCYLKKTFDKVYLIPTSSSINTISRYDEELENIVICPLQRQKKSFEILKGLLCIIGDVYFYQDVFRLFKLQKNFNIINIRELLIYYINAIVCFKSTKNIIQKTAKQDDGIIIYSYWFSSSSFLAIMLKKYLKKNKYQNVIAVSRAHGLGDCYFGDGSSLYRPNIFKINKFIDKIYCISRSAQLYLSKSGIQSSLLSLNRLGVAPQISLSNFQIKRRNRAYFMIVSCSTLNLNKRVNLIIEALALISDVKIRWIHFGGGSLYNLLSSECSKSLCANIQWTLMGTVSNCEILNYYINENPDCFVNVSSIEGVPVSIMEAMACGIPVIATDVGGTSEIVENAKNGFLLQKDATAQDLKDTILMLYNLSIENQNILRREAFLKWKNDYNANCCYKRFAKDLENTLYDNRI